MPTFHYKGRNQRGEAVHGSLEAVTADAVAAQLFNTGVTPVDITETKASTDVIGSLRLKFGAGKIETQEMALLCRQMYTLLKAGVPIMQALRGLQTSAKNPAMARVINSVHDTLDSGQDLTAALKRHPDVFPSLFVALVQVGESTGTLEDAFLRIGRHLEQEKETRDRVKSALRYPMFVFIAIGVAMVIINVFVIPAFAKMFTSFRIELPWATKILMATSQFTIANGPLLLVGFIALVVGTRAYLKTPSGRYRWHKAKLKIPIIGPIIYQAMLARFAAALAMTIKTGVPLVQGLTAVSRAVDNDYIAARIVQIRDGVERGESITRTAAATGMFPPLVLQMIGVGEETGSIDTLMEDVNEYYTREVDHALKNLSGALEPILLVVIGVLVLILALGVFLPMWDITKAARPT